VNIALEIAAKIASVKGPVVNLKIQVSMFIIRLHGITFCFRSKINNTTDRVFKNEKDK
jgi:hypothetical protein